MLAISLHAVRDELRDELVPINRKWPIAELIDACRDYPGLSNARRITFEYVMLKGVNDSLAEARELVRLLAGIPGQDQPDPVQPMAGRALRMLRLGADRGVRRGGEPRRLRLADPHAARPRHLRRVRAAEERQRADAKKRTRRGGSRRSSDVDAQTFSRWENGGAQPFSIASAISSTFTTVFQFRAVPATPRCFSSRALVSFERPMPFG